LRYTKYIYQKSEKVPGVEFMDCLKGESEVKKKDAKFACGRCGATVKKKSHVCKPVKVSEPGKASKKKPKKEKK